MTERSLYSQVKKRDANANATASAAMASTGFQHNQNQISKERNFSPQATSNFGGFNHNNDQINHQSSFKQQNLLDNADNPFFQIDVRNLDQFHNSGQTQSIQKEPLKIPSINPNRNHYESKKSQRSKSGQRSSKNSVNQIQNSQMNPNINSNLQIQGNNPQLTKPHQQSDAAKIILNEYLNQHSELLQSINNTNNLQKLSHYIRDGVKSSIGYHGNRRDDNNNTSSRLNYTNDLQTSQNFNNLTMNGPTKTAQDSNQNNNNNSSNRRTPYQLSDAQNQDQQNNNQFHLSKKYINSGSFFTRKNQQTNNYLQPNDQHNIPQIPLRRGDSGLTSDDMGAHQNLIGFSQTVGIPTKNNVKNTNGNNLQQNKSVKIRSFTPNLRQYKTGGQVNSSLTHRGNLGSIEKGRDENDQRAYPNFRSNTNSRENLSSSKYKFKQIPLTNKGINNNSLSIMPLNSQPNQQHLTTDVLSTQEAAFKTENDIYTQPQIDKYQYYIMNTNPDQIPTNQRSKKHNNGQNYQQNQNQNGVTNSAAKLGDDKNNSSQSSLNNNQNNIPNKNVSSPTSNSNGNLNNRPKSKQSGQRNQLKQKQDEKMEQIKQIYLKNDKRSKSSGRGSKLNEIPEQGYNQNGNYLTDSQKSIPKQRQNNPFYVQQISHQLEEFGDEVEEIDVTEMFKKQSKLQQMDYNHNLQFQQIKPDKNNSASKQNKRYQNKDLEDSDLEGANSRLRQSHLPAKGSQQSSNNTQNDVLGTTGASVTGYSLNHLINNEDNAAQQKTIRLDDINDSFHTEVNQKRANDSSQIEKTQSSQNKNTSSIYAKVIQKITQNNGSQLQNSSKLHAINNNSGDQKQIPNQTNSSILSTSQQGFRRSTSSFTKQKIGTENGSNQKNQMNQSQHQQKNNSSLQNQDNVRGSFSANPSVQNLNNHNNENNLSNINNQNQQQQRCNSKSQIRKKTISQTGSSKKSQSSFEQYPEKNQKNENEQIQNQNHQLNQPNQQFTNQNQSHLSSSKKEKTSQKFENQDQLQGSNKDKQQKENNNQGINSDKQVSQQSQSQQQEYKNDKNNSLSQKKENQNLENQINHSSNKNNSNNNNQPDQQHKNIQAKKEGQNENLSSTKPPLITNSIQVNGSQKNNNEICDKNNISNQISQQKQSNNSQQNNGQNESNQKIDDKITLSQIKQDKSIVIDSDMTGRLKSNDSQQQSSLDDKQQQVNLGLKEKQSSLNNQDNHQKSGHNQEVYPQKKLSNESNNQLNKDSGISSRSTKENGIKSQIQQIQQDVVNNLQEAQKEQKQNNKDKSKLSSDSGLQNKQIKNEKELSNSQQQQKKQLNESKNSDNKNLDKVQQDNSQQRQNEINHAESKSNEIQNNNSSIKKSQNLNSTISQQNQLQNSQSQEVNLDQNNNKQNQQLNKNQTSQKQNDNSLNDSKNQSKINQNQSSSDQQLEQSDSNINQADKNNKISKNSQLSQNNNKQNQQLNKNQTSQKQNDNSLNHSKNQSKIDQNQSNSDQQLEQSNSNINQADKNNKISKNSQSDESSKNQNSKMNQEKDLNKKEVQNEEEVNKQESQSKKDLKENKNSQKDQQENLKKKDELEQSNKQKNINQNHKDGEQHHSNSQKDLKESKDSKKDQIQNISNQNGQDKQNKNVHDNQKSNLNNQKDISQDSQLSQSDSKKDLNQRNSSVKKKSIINNSQISNSDKNKESQNSSNKLKNNEDQLQSEQNSSKDNLKKDKSETQKKEQNQQEQQLSQNLKNRSDPNINDSESQMQKSKREQDASLNNSSKISKRKDSLNKNNQQIDEQSNQENKSALSQRKSQINNENQQKNVNDQEAKNNLMEQDKNNSQNQNQLNESSDKNQSKSSLSQSKINQDDLQHSNQSNQQSQNLKEEKEDKDRKSQVQGQGQDKVNIDQNAKIINETNGRADGVVIREIREQNGNELRIITEARIIIQNENKDDKQGGKKQKQNNLQENGNEEEDDEDCDEQDQSESKLKKTKKKQKNDKNNKFNKENGNIPLESQLDSDDECESYENGKDGQLKKRNKKANKMMSGEDKQFLEDQVNLINHQTKGQNKVIPEKRNSQSSQKTKEDISYTQNTHSDQRSSKAEQSGANTPNKNNTDISNFIKAQDTSHILLNEEIQKDPQNHTYDESINDQNSILAQLKSNQGSLKNLNPINTLNNQQDQQHHDNSLNLNYQEELLNEINTEDKQKKENSQNSQKENQQADQQSGVNQEQSQKQDTSKKQESSQNNGASSPSQNKKQPNKYKEILNKNLVQVQRYPIKETEGEESLHIVHDDTSDEHDQIVKVKILQDQQTRNSHSSYESLKQIRKKGEQNNSELDEIERNKLNSLTPEELLDLRIQQNKRRIRKINRRPHIIKQDMEKLIENAIIFDIKCRLPKNIDFIEEIKTDPRHGELAFGRESYLLDSAPKIRSFRGYDQEMMRPCAMMLYLIDQYCDPQIVKEWHLMQHFQYNAQIEENRFLNLQMNTQKNSSSLTESNVTKKNFCYGNKAEVSTSQNIFLNPTLLLMDSPLVYEFRHFEYNFFLEVEDFYPIEQILLNRFKDRKIYEEDELIFIFTSLIECVLGFRAKNICLGNIQIEHVAFCPASNSYKFFNLTKAQVYEEQNQEKKYNIYYSKIYQPPEIAEIEGQKDHGQIFNIFAGDLYALGITLLCFKYHLISNNRTSNFIQNRIEMCKNSMQLSGIIINYLLEQDPKQRLLNMKFIQKDLHDYLKKNNQVNKKLSQQEILSPPPPSSPNKTSKNQDDVKPGIKLNPDEFKNEKLIAVNPPQKKQKNSDTEDSDDENLDEIKKNSNIICTSWNTNNNKYFMHRSNAPDYELEVYWNEGKSINNQKLNPPSIKKIAKQIHDRIQSAQDIARMYKYTFQWEKASNQYINNLEIMKQQSNKVSDSEILRTVNQIWQSLYYNNELEDSLHYNEVYFNNIHTLFIHDEVSMAYDHLLSGKLKWILNHKVDSSQDFDIALMCTEQYPLDKAKVLILLGDFFAEDSEISAEQYYKDALEILQTIILNQKDVMKSSATNNFMKDSQATMQTTEEEQDFDDLFEREEYVIMKLKERTQHQLAIIEDIQMSELREKLVFLEENSQKLSSIEKAKIQLDVANQYCHQFLKYNEADYYYQEALNTLQCKQPNKQSSEAMRSSSQQKMATSSSREKRMKKSSQQSEIKEAQQQQQLKKNTSSSSSSASINVQNKDLDYDIQKFRIVNYLKMNNEDEANKMIQKIVADNTPENGIKNIDNILQLAIILEENLFHEYCLELYNRCYALATVQLGAKNEFTLKLKDKINKL
ncbi:cation channel family protein (macronuclear) [Tetrahymena thermophila SB210]|uniref:Cation channel family protein n=1 Tax=Tetrahymena thermophila (strain SB210) TaxID=312017 RepID=I7MEH2_TETTS|nr:cation channel family protein [Tetrahymena thermophila SB210]EAR96353.2 cation channel family protein [Tetrahymena thermophila SB210]|eukprot:XP_001016598.2 cation channel family protein [Tetrahymena thermophila SB210]